MHRSATDQTVVPRRRTVRYHSSDCGGVSSGDSGPLPSSRISVSSNSVMVITPGTGASTVSPMIVSVACVVEGFVGLTFFRASFFAPTRLTLASPNAFLALLWLQSALAIFLAQT